MSAEQLDAEVAAAVAELAACSAERATIVDRLVAALVPVVAAAFERIVIGVVVDEFEVTTKLGPQLSIVKRELQSVAAAIPEQVAQWIAHDHWQDRFANRTNNTYAPVRWKLDPQGDRVRADDPTSLQSHVEQMLTFFVRSTMSTYDYKAPHHYGVSWIGEPAGITTEYEHALVELEQARLRHKAAVTARQRFEAKSLWDKA